MSKKLFYIRIVIATICLLLICLFIFLFSSIQKSVNIDSTVDETTINEEKVVFDLRKTPKQQKKEIYAHPKEYFKQLYNYTFKDEKFSNCFSYDFFSVYEIVDYYRDTENLVNVLKKFQYSALFNILFDGYRKERQTEVTILIPLDDLPVTENYKLNHAKPLYEEFDFIKKEDYKSKKKYYREYTNSDYWYEFDYKYGAGVDEEKKEVCVGEEKYVSKVFVEDGVEKSGIVRDKDGNEIPAYVETRNIYFKYTTDEKGYVDDIVYDRTEIITDDKYLDNLINYE